MHTQRDERRSVGVSPTKTLNVILSWHKYTRADARNSTKIQLTKDAKYTRIASRVGAELLNVAIDTSGSLAQGAMRLVEAIGEEGARWSAGTWTSAAIKRHLLSAIAVAVQRGNALTMLCGYCSAVRGAASDEDETGQ